MINIRGNKNVPDLNTALYAYMPKHPVLPRLFYGILWGQAILDTDFLSNENSKRPLKSYKY